MAIYTVRVKKNKKQPKLEWINQAAFLNEFTWRVSIIRVYDDNLEFGENKTICVQSCLLLKPLFKAKETF